MSEQIRCYFEANTLFSLSQFGYRRGKNTTEAINNFVNLAISCFERGRHCGASFVDLSRAFDSVTRDKLLFKLKKYGFDTSALNLVDSFLSERCQTVCVNGVCSGLRKMTVGVAQGSNLGPLLFLFFCE